MPTYKKYSSGASISGGTNKTFEIAAFTVPDGETLKQFKVTKNVANSWFSTRPLKTNGVAPVWDKYYTDTTIIGWTNGNIAKVIVHNGDSSSHAVTVGVTYETIYTPVKAGNKILATDRSKSGIATTKGAVMTDEHWAKGTSITASAFNSAYGYK